jgi:hypothetical protein
VEESVREESAMIQPKLILAELGILLVSPTLTMSNRDSQSTMIIALFFFENLHYFNHFVKRKTVVSL